MSQKVETRARVPDLENWEARLRELETTQTDLLSARTALESALTAQLRELAAGRLADRLLTKQKITELAWWRHYQCERAGDGPDAYIPDLDDPGFRAFRDQFVQSAVRRQVRRISQSTFAATTLRIIGETVPIWREGRVNRQLADLGSSFRLFIVGAERSRCSAIRNQLVHSSATPFVDGRFLFGEVAPCTAVAGGILYNFKRELAVAPDLEHDTPGFAEKCRMVIRAACHGKATYQKSREFFSDFLAQVGKSSEEIDEICRNMWRGVLGHEMGHVHNEGITPMTPGGLDNWRAAVRDDLCRFARVPRTLEEIHQNFGYLFDLTRNTARLVTGDFLPKWGQLDVMLYTLMQENLLVVHDHNTLHCPLYEDHRPWRMVCPWTSPSTS